MSAAPLPPFPVPIELGRPGADRESSESMGPIDAVEGVAEIIVVASGKGGVGKSTVSVNLALALSTRGRRVGIIDADLYGPSIARMLGTGEGLAAGADGRVLPAERHGIFSVSVANILPAEAALVWKGPLVSQGVLQMFRDVAWPDVDVLLVDLPPGSGDVPLTILEQVPVTGALVVTTPQRLALVDADRGIAMFHQRDIPVLGLIENMARYVCPCCGEEQALFPDGGASRLAARRHVRHLGQIPLAPDAQERVDAGVPLVLAERGGRVARAFADIAALVDDGVLREQRARARERDADERAQHQAFWERLLDDE
jgi:ATP-binding protein involved in chromosome partitioning